MTELQQGGTQAALADAGRGSVSKYRSIVVGQAGLLPFLRYELITGLFGQWPGGAGLLLRRLFYPCLFRACGRGVVFGRGLTLRHPHRISIGNGVVLEEGCTLDAKGSEGEGILIRDRVFVGKGCILTMADGTIELDEGCNISSYCRIGTFGTTRIGRKVLLGAYCYVVGAYHETERTDIPIMDQPNRTKGGAEVGDGCWIGARVTVLDGVKVGRDSVVGAHAVVTKDLPEFCIALGSPAKVTKMRK